MGKCCQNFASEFCLNIISDDVIIVIQSAVVYIIIKGREANRQGNLSPTGCL